MLTIVKEPDKKKLAFESSPKPTVFAPVDGGNKSISLFNLPKAAPKVSVEAVVATFSKANDLNSTFCNLTSSKAIKEPSRFNCYICFFNSF